MQGAVMAICGNIQQGDKSHFFFENIQTIENSLANQPDDKLRRIALSALFQQASIEALWQKLFWTTHATAIGPITSLALAAVDTAL
jgi:L-alanine-DL-glutamate epimerase-like enolase superfamily enzyme